MPIHSGEHLQPLVRGGAPDATQQSVVAKQGITFPVLAHRSKKAMFDRIPLGSASRVMAHRHLQARPIDQVSLQAVLPQMHSTAIATTAIGQQQQLWGTGITLLAIGSPPPEHGGHGKFGSVGRGPYRNKAFVATGVVQPVGNGNTFGQAQVIVNVDRKRFPTPGLAAILEKTYEFTFLGIDAEHRPAMPEKLAFFPLQVPELAVPVRAGGSQVFAIDLGGIVQIGQEPTNRGRTDLMPGSQFLAQVAEAATLPFAQATGIAQGIFFQQLFEVGDQGSVFFFRPGVARPRVVESVLPGGRSPVRAAPWRWF
jgi:hypothetical protein